MLPQNFPFSYPSIYFTFAPSLLFNADGCQNGDGHITEATGIANVSVSVSVTVTVTVSFSVMLAWSGTGMMEIATNVELGGAGAAVICGVSTGVTIVFEDGSGLVTVTNFVDVAVGSGWKVMVMVLVIGEVEDRVASVTGLGPTGSTVVAGIVTGPPAADIVGVETTRPRTLDATALFVHSTTTPAMVFIGIAKHSDPVVHKLITKLPSWLQVPVLPLMQARVPALQGEEKLSSEKRAL